MKRPLTLRCAILATCLAVGAGCAATSSTPDPRPTARHRVAVLQSSDNPLFRAPASRFVSQLGDEISVYAPPARDLEEDISAVEHFAPALVFALGSRAALAAAARVEDVPILYTMVVNPERHRALRQPRAMGIGLEVPPAAEFTQFRMVLPNLRRVLVFYCPRESSNLIERARRDLVSLGIEILAVAVNSAAEVERAYARAPHDVDGVWLVNDPVVLTPDNFRFLRDRSARDRLPLLCSLSERFARQGAFASVSLDPGNLGSQAASMARLVLEFGRSPADVGLQPPIGGRLVVNGETARQLGVAIPEQALPFIGEIVATE